MRTNSMTTCAMGAIFVGCTLAMTREASAGLTWLSEANGYYSQFAIQSGPVGDTRSGAPAIAPAVTLQLSDGFTVDFAHSSTGCSWAVTQVPSSNSAISIGHYMVFSLTESMNFAFAGVPFDSNTSQGSFAGLINWNGSSWQQVGGYFFNGDSGNLSAGTYVFMSSTQLPSGTSAAGLSSSLTFTAVPAPGAMVLLGAAGLVGGRRRRA